MAPIPRLRNKEAYLMCQWGLYDGAEVCEILGTYMLNGLSKKNNNNDLGLYRDDGPPNFLT